MAIFAQQTIDLNLVPGAVLPVVNVSQYDSGYQINFRLYDGSQRFDIPTAVNLRMDMTKPDKHGVSATVSKNNAIPSMCYVWLTEQMTAIAGDSICEVVLIHNTDNKRIGTVNFIMRVEPAAIRDDTIISDSALNTVQQKIDKWSGLAAYGDALDGLINSRASTTQFGLVKKWDRYTTPSDWGEQGTAYVPDISLVNGLHDAITPDVYVGFPAGFVFGDSFDANNSYAYARRMHDVVQVTFAARVKTGTPIPAGKDRNIITNLAKAMMRTYVQAFTITYSTDGSGNSTPSAVIPVMCAIRPEESASNSNQILKVDAATNPTAVAAGQTIFGTFTYITNDR